MEITINEIQKIKKALEILGFSEREISKQINEMGKLLMVKILTEALEKKGYKSIDGSFNSSNIEKFLKENYSQEEILKISKEISAKFIADYFANITKNVPNEKRVEVGKIIDSDLAKNH